MNLNGVWDFEQTTTAWVPATFTRSIPIPGLVHLATPRIDEYEKFFKRPGKVEAKKEHGVYNIDYTPKYSWYRKKLFIPHDVKDLEGVLTIKKSQYVTQIFVNGIGLGSFMECYTPIEVAATRALKFGQENEIIIKVGDRYWLPSAAAGSTDKEKEHYLPGIWDDVSLTFTNKLRVNKVLVLPHLRHKKVTVKIKLWNLNPAQIYFGESTKDSLLLNIKIKEKISGKLVADKQQQYVSIRDRNNELETEIPLTNIHPWSPEDPFLYTAEVSVFYKGRESDAVQKNFGMRDFERHGKFFYLNGNKYYLRGSNITLQRFFEDPDCGGLAWDKNWVKKMLIDIPKQLNWNAMRICVGIVPDFWYDLADEYGLLFQNEWFYWQNHGWDEQIRKEYTDWVWSDGSHPSIAIWDGINENWDDYIGNVLIPDLKELDPTRIWDAGFMTSTSMQNDDMDEPHPYQGVSFFMEKNQAYYPLGDLNYKPVIMKELEESSSAQLVNEYGWVWLWRNGTPSKLTVEVYDKYLGKNSTPKDRWQLQAYWLQLETEWLRSNRNIAGVLAFCHLTNNYGYTGDWFVGNIKNLKPSPVLHWFNHAFAPANIFINLVDGRYVKEVPAHKPGSQLNFTLVGVNDHNKNVTGILTVKLINSAGKEMYREEFNVELSAADRVSIASTIKLP
ncbi:MAG: glycoside hydrolase family 2, partial [Bacteroidetes bacterium]|nr:glycoside hydrolase family 2 [Bacteroidota bacterium]